MGVGRLAGLVALAFAVFGTGEMARPDALQSYLIQGHHALFGSYQGTLSLRASGPGGGRVAQRLITYDSHSAYGLQVQELWQGDVENDLHGTRVRYRLKRGDYILEIPGVLRRTDQDFQEQLEVVAPFDGRASRFLVDGAEVVEAYSPTATADVWWQSQRSRTSAFGTEMNLLVRLAKWLAIDRVITWYQSLPQLDPYRENPEFVAQTPYFVTDLTDLEFYRSHPQILRVVQKRLDAISLLESYQRYLAFAPTLKAKAASYEANMKYHINELGIYSRAIWSADGRFVGYGPEGDSGLWTGMYASTLATKYLVTFDPDTLVEFRRVLRGVVTLMEAPGGSEFARQALLLAPGESPEPPWFVGKGAYSHVKYLAGGNNDMFKGLISTLTWAQTLLDKAGASMPADIREELRLTVQRKSSDLLSLKLLKSKRPNRTPAYGLIAWSKGDHRAYLKFLEDYRNWVYIQKQIGIDGGFYFGAITDWSGVNLSIVTESCMLLIAEGLARKFPEEQSSPPSYDGQPPYPSTAMEVAFEQKQTFRKMWRTNAAAHRDFLTVATQAFAAPDLVGDIEFKREVKRPPVNSIKTYADFWQWSKSRWALSLIQFPDRKGEFDFLWDHSRKVDFTLSPWPKLPWKSVAKRQPADYHIQGLESYPPFEGFAFGSSWFWKEIAFEFRGGVTRQASLSGGDYLYLYWLARYAGWLDEHGEPKP